MRPIRLTMQAFGPYRAQQTVDFTELGPNRVFLIHGDTGAGKTTILDAMVFALYGDTSGGERQAFQMRCESAPPTLATEVVFEFALGARSFRVRRRPAQELAGARSAIVARPAEATLWDRTGCREGQEGRLLTTKITEANTIIRDTLGFSCDQFRQVVVLPQGRFRELLSAGSDKREEILRQLFRTQRFRQLEEALAERAKAIRAQVQELKAQRDAQLSVVEVADDAELAGIIDAANSELVAATDSLAQAALASQAADEALTAAEAADEARNALSAARTELETLEARKDEFATLRRRVETATRADKVQLAADRLGEARGRLAAASTACRDAHEALGVAREAEQAATDALAAESGRATEREAAADNLRRLEGLTVVIEAWTQAKRDWASTEERVDSARQTASAAAEAQVLAEQHLKSLQEQLTAAGTAATRVEGARARLKSARQHEDRCRRLLAARDVVAATEERQARLAVAETDALEAFGKAESERADLEERWKAGRAVALAAGLTPGSPCPVCGATDHPAPAQAGATDVSDDQLATARAAAEHARHAHLAAHEASAHATNELTGAQTAERSIRQEPGAQPDLRLADAESAVAVCLAELDELSLQAEIGELESQVISADAAAAAARTIARTASDNLINDEKALAVIETQANERVAAVPDDLRGAGALEAATDRVRRLKAELEAAFAAAQQRQSEAKDKRIALESAAAAAAAVESAAADHQNVCAVGFDAALAQHVFPSEEEWRRALLPESEHARLEVELDAYSDAVNQAKGRLHQAELAVAGQPESGGGLGALRSAADAAREAHTDAITRRARAQHSLENLARIRQALADIDIRSANVLQTYETVGVLADVANGVNSSRVSFQRWVLGVYLDEVLVSASRRLFAMSKGRYQLQRQKEAAGRGRASGLDLAVLDEFSGRARPAVTLSGGESFLAALALALGLAETVQEHAAGIPLETIFVDEGFGALDNDALELAIDALMELQLGGRLVGVISHVAELRQVIPARLEVHGGSTGSSARFAVP